MSGLSFTTHVFIQRGDTTIAAVGLVEHISVLATFSAVEAQEQGICAITEPLAAVDSDGVP